MQRISICAGLALLIANSPGAAGTGVPAEESVDRAVAAAAASAFAGQLKQALVGAMSSVGPVAAIEVCHEQAPAIAARVSAEFGVRVSRTSERTRNSNNAADDWQAEVLGAWAARRDAGDDPAQFEYFDERPDGGLRYMKAIVVQPVCVTCHGKSLEPGVRSALGSLYPDDHATGYEAGDLRGAYVVERQSAPPAK